MKSHKITYQSEQSNKHIVKIQSWEVRKSSRSQIIVVNIKYFSSFNQFTNVMNNNLSSNSSFPWQKCNIAGTYNTVCCCWFWCSGTGKHFSNGKETGCLPLLNAGFEAGKSETPNCQRTKCPLTNLLSYRGSCKNWTQTPMPMMIEHSAHLTSLLIGSRTWLWWYTFVVVNFNALTIQLIDLMLRTLKLKAK